MGRDEFYAFVTNDELRELIDGLLDGVVQPNEFFVRRFAELVAPRIHRLSDDGARSAATEIAIGAARAFPLAIRDWTLFGPLVVTKLDSQFRWHQERSDAVLVAIETLSRRLDADAADPHKQPVRDLLPGPT